MAKPNLKNFNFGKVTKNVKKQTGTDFSTDEAHLTRKDRKTIQINKKYYFIIRKLVFKHPETTFTMWADQALQHAVDDGLFNK